MASAITSHSRRCLCLGIPVLFGITLFGCADLDPNETITAPGSDALDLAGENVDIWDGLLRQALLEQSSTGRLSEYILPLEYTLPKIPQDPLNPLTPVKVELGRLLYHETALARNNVREQGEETYSCASCHFAQAGFQANIPQGLGEGGLGFGVAGEGRVVDPDYIYEDGYPDCQPIRSPSSMNDAFQELVLWNGQFGGVGDNLGTEDRWLEGTPLESNWLGMEGLETQAHAGLTVHRMGDVDLCGLEQYPEYVELFSDAFPGDDPPINRLNAALAIAAYERTLLSNQAPFQRWLRRDYRAMTLAEKRGALLFFGRARCSECHTGPALNSMEFYALGMNDLDGAYDPSRVVLMPFGGTVPDAVRRGRGGFTGRPEDDYKFKVPQLYNLMDSPFYGHGASFATLREVIEYKNEAVAENPLVPAGQLAEGFVPLGLTSGEIDDLVAFVRDALYDPNLMRYVPDELPSGNCFPNADPQSRFDLGCEPLILP